MNNIALIVALLVSLLSEGQVAPGRTPAHGGALAVIVAKSRPMDGISLAELRHIYLGRTTRWPDGHRIVPVVMPNQSAEQRCFLRLVVTTAEVDFVQLWIGLVFRGRAAAPPVVAASSLASRELVAQNPYAIGLIDAAAVGNVVKVVPVDGRAPSEPGYPLRWKRDD